MPEAAGVAARRSLAAACGSPTSPAQVAALSDRWPGVDRDALRLTGHALALACPPGAEHT